MDRVTSVRAIATRYAARRGPLLPILHAVQSEHGSITRPDVVAIADVLNISIADVHGVVSFYSDFRSTPHLLTRSRYAVPRPASRSAARPCMTRLWPDLPTAPTCRCARCFVSATARSARQGRSTAASVGGCRPIASPR